VTRLRSSARPQERFSFCGACRSLLIAHRRLSPDASCESRGVFRGLLHVSARCSEVLRSGQSFWLWSFLIGDAPPREFLPFPSGSFFSVSRTILDLYASSCQLSMQSGGRHVIFSDFFDKCLSFSRYAAFRFRDRIPSLTVAHHPLISGSPLKCPHSAPSIPSL